MTTRCMSRTGAFTLILVAGCLLQATDPLAAEDDPRELVMDAMRAGFERGDLAAYMKIWAADARIVQQRDESASDSIQSVTAGKQIELTRRLNFSAIPPGLIKLKFESLRLELEPDQATWRCRATVVIGQEGDEETVIEVYQLKRIGGEWKVVTNTWWPVSSRHQGRTRVFNRQTWSELDRKAEALEKNSTDLNPAVLALADAFRFQEAHKLAAKLVKQEPRNVDARSLLGWMALRAGDGEAAREAFEQALKLDPMAPVPAPVRASDPKAREAF